MIGRTIYINLDNPSYNNEYNRGVLYSIQNGKLIYHYQNNIYMAGYYPTTLAISSVKSLATGDFEYMLEDEDSLYFNSLNEDNSISIFSVNKSNQNINILDRCYTDGERKINIVSSAKSDKYIFILLKKIVVLEETLEIKAIAKDGTSSKTLPLTQKIDGFEFTLKDDAFFEVDGILYKYNFNQNEVNEASNETNIPNIYKLKMNSNNVILYKNGDILSTILKGYEGSISKEKIDLVGDYIYIRFDISSSNEETVEYMFWRIKQDGTELERLNNTF